MTDETTKTFNNHVITLTKDWTFTVTGPEFEDSNYKMIFGSLEAAKTEIVKRVEDAARLAAKNITLNVRVIDQQGERVTISRINRANGEVIGLPSRYFYPNEFWILDALTKMKKLKAEVEAIEKKLKDVAIDRTRAYGRIDADSYGRHMEQLKKDIAEAMTKAKEIAELKTVDEVESA